MKRRKFVAGAASMAAGELLPTSDSSAQTQTTSIAAHRNSRLFDVVSAGSNMQVQDLVIWGDLIYCLYFSLPSRRSGFSVTKPEGTSLWQCELPTAKYLSIGLQGGSVILTALTFPDSAGHNQANCIIRLDPTGTTELLQSLGTSFNGRLVFAADSTFVRIDNAAVDVWRLSGSAIKGGPTHSLQPCLGVPHVDLLSSGKVVLICPDGSTITGVDLTSGVVETHPINVPEVKVGIAAYQSRLASNPAMGQPGVIPATGSDGTA